ncbi:MAG: Uma2 family endonuclease [Pirellulaceae bacterium]|nr:Uma2 family endonuclease [Pirellulaceae bacterium]
MSTKADRTQDVASSIPALRAGDRLSREEFERRYAVMPRVKKAELIEGVVYMPSPVSTEYHGAPHAALVGWLVYFQSQTPGVQVADNATVRLDWDNEPQPDAFLRILPAHGGQTRDEDGYVAGGPEWAGEIAASSASYDLHDKKEAYRRNNVREYLVWRVEDAAIDWFVLRGGRYDRLEADTEGRLRSEVFPGLWLDPAALLAGDIHRVLQVLQSGLDTEEHAALVLRLAGGPTGPATGR